MGNRSREISPEKRELQLSFESAGQDVYFKTCYQPTTLLHNSLVSSVLIQHWDKGLMPSWPNLCKMCGHLRVALNRDILQGPILGGVLCSKDYGICDVRRTAKRSLTWEKAVLDTCFYSNFYLCSFPSCNSPQSLITV